VDTQSGSVTRDIERGPWTRFQLTRAERDTIKHAILLSGFFDWPRTLGTQPPRLTNPDFRDESELHVRAGKLDHEVLMVDSFGRDDEPRANRQAKRLMRDLEQLIHHVVDARSEFKKLPDPPPYL
jgi:hypothetical protein